MTSLMMALLALIVFGAIGMLLTSAVIPEHPVHLRAAKRNATHLMTTCCGLRCDFRRRRLP
jgi:hypothetical protein